MFKSCPLACTISVSNMSLSRGGKQLYEAFNYTFTGGKITSILGPSGCGKTSLLHVISSLLKPNSGSVRLSCSIEEDHDAKEIKPSYLFQEHRLLPWYTVEKNISLILEGRQTLNGSFVYDKKNSQQTALDFLEKVGLTAYAQRYPAQLSGGERQRVSLARAFAYPSPILLMDEAFQSQDIHLKLQLMDLLFKLHEESPRTVLMVTHDIREALSLSSRVLVLTGSPLHIRLNEPVPSDGLPSATYIQFPKRLHDLECTILQILASINECPVYPV